ncbi:probable LRR receptor-like serine/threonine-protein kinase At5g45780 [Arachis ipaensis]|uniref:probable LRR receptor-like serine/threonine-protein kinase At5g45780 n=1 Tax=Arachis ipaensis TaxID=130454 RepID=UPI000A2B4F45|nr:probable LRR receptor-like serine/threonine-protein kinase At5g45780 [Arachis ipaensis]
MASAGLSGTLSSEIGNLSHLRTLLLQNNQLSGSIPTKIGKLSELQTLDLSSNQFVGEIPSSLGLLSQLSYLWLGKNNLSGQISNLTGTCHLIISMVPLQKFWQKVTVSSLIVLDFLPRYATAKF